MRGGIFDKAIAVLHEGTQPEIVKETIAKRIIALGEGRTQSRPLCNVALATLDVRKTG